MRAAPVLFIREGERYRKVPFGIASGSSVMVLQELPQGTFICATQATFCFLPTAGTTHLMIQGSTRECGIGTTTPQQKLVVAGTTPTYASFDLPGMMPF